ncbi:MAG: hypothetical protein WC261_09415 [Synergistaceae bacterium]|jgi:hypothetical protein
MPTPYLEKKAKETGRRLETLERLWSESKASAARQGQKENYAYITGIFERRLGRNRRRSIKKVHMSVKESAALLLRVP